VKWRDFLRAVILANGILVQPLVLKEGDILIAANGGVRHCLESGLQPSIVIGDLDSLHDRDISTLENNGVEIIRFPRRKDFTDLELAINHAAGLKIREIVIVAALGARWDQTIANILLPSRFPSIRITLMDGPQEIHYIYSGERFEITGKPGDIVSLIPIGGDVCGITTKGLEYPLTDERLPFGGTRGLSNLLLNEQGYINIKSGILLCTVIHQMK
jgi:thiamine pyrophosphokinase